MNQQLDNKKVAILATDGFKQVELTKPNCQPERLRCASVAWWRFKPRSTTNQFQSSRVR